jgi:uncharacterized Fe-S center protein
MLCSFDPVALDQACVDLCNKQDAIINSQLGENLAKSRDKTGDVFHDNNVSTDGRSALEHAEEIGLGTRNYELIVIK